MMVKDKNHPKSPMSAYACFVQVIREEYKKKYPNEDIVFNEFTKKCGERWKQMSTAQRRCFEELAKLDLERFNREMAQYVPPTGIRRGRRRRRIKDPAMPKRSWSAFFFFCDAHRSKIRSEHPEWKVSEVAKELGRRWEECTDKEKYERHAQNDKLRYEQDMQKYKAGIYVATKRSRVEDVDNNDTSEVSLKESRDDTEKAESSYPIDDAGEEYGEEGDEGEELDEEEEGDEDEYEEETEAEGSVSATDGAMSYTQETDKSDRAEHNSGGDNGRQQIDGHNEANRDKPVD